MGEDAARHPGQLLAEAPGAGERALRGVDRPHRVHAAAEAVDRLPGIADPDRRAALGLQDGQGDRVGVLGLVDVEHLGPVRQASTLELPHLQVGVVLERHRAGGVAQQRPELAGPGEHGPGAVGPPRQRRQVLGADPARGAVVGEAAHGRDHAVAPKGRAQAVEGRDRQQLGHVAAGELALEAVQLAGHAHGAEGQAVHGAAGGMGGEAGPGRELGGLVVGEVEARGRVGLGEELKRGGLAGAGEGEDAQRALRVGAAGGDDGVLLGAGLQGGLPGAPRRRPKIGCPAGAARGEGTRSPGAKRAIDVSPSERFRWTNERPGRSVQRCGRKIHLAA